MPPGRRTQTCGNLVSAIRNVKHFYDLMTENRFTWYRFHKGELIRETSRYKINMIQDAKLFYLVSLEINSVTASDEGEYKAVAKNTHGEGIATISLNFEGSGKPK